MPAALGHADEALKLLAEAGDELSPLFLTKRACVYLYAHRPAEALADTEAVLADERTTSNDLVLARLANGWAHAQRGDLDSARKALDEGLRQARETQMLAMLPDLYGALAYLELAAGDLLAASCHVRGSLRQALLDHDYVTALSTLHIAVVPAHRTGSSQAARIAAAVNCPPGRSPPASTPATRARSGSPRRSAAPFTTRPSSR